MRGAGGRIAIPRQNKRGAEGCPVRAPFFDRVRTQPFRRSGCSGGAELPDAGKAAEETAAAGDEQGDRRSESCQHAATGERSGGGGGNGAADEEKA